MEICFAYPCQFMFDLTQAVIHEGSTSLPMCIIQIMYVLTRLAVIFEYPLGSEGEFNECVYSYCRAS